MAGYFNLSHDQYNSTATDTLKSLVIDQDFTDVTLACEGDKHIKAHKVILGAYSSVLKNIIVNIKQQNPVIYISGIKYEELRAVVNFIYLGETKVKQETFAKFMEFAQEFEIKGLAANLAEQKKSDTEDTIPPKGKIEEEEELIKNIEYEFSENNKDDDKMFGDIELLKPETSHLETGLYTLETQLSEAKNWIQTVEDKKRFQCPKCPKELSDKSNLSRHVRTQHDGVKYACDMCDYVGAQSSNLNYHKNAKHSEKNPYECQNCAKKFSDKSNLGRHIKSQHEGVTYPCKFCDFKAKQTSHLKGHIISWHKEATDNTCEGK